MTNRYVNFDKNKRNLGNRWKGVGVFHTREIEDLILEGFRLYFYSIFSKNLKLEVLFQAFIKKVVILKEKLNDPFRAKILERIEKKNLMKFIKEGS